MALYRSFAFLCLIIIQVTFASGLSDEERFTNFIKTYGKSYRKGSEEYDTRFENFKKSLERHKKLLLSENNGAVYGVTKFSDLTEAEFAEQFLSHRRLVNITRVSSNYRSPQQFSDIPEKYDLRNKRAVTAIKNQGQCGGCWAFSIVETLETQYDLKYHKLYTLSVQEVLDCDKDNYGCNGGNICAAARWLNKTSVKLTTDKVYPFTDSWGSCKTIKKSDQKVGITNYSCDSYREKETLMVDAIVNHGPLTVAVDATSWQDYVSGIIQHHCSDQGDNHAVQIIGYDISGDVPYFIVRNSWGKDWGMDGYLYIKIGQNLCGIANEVVTLTV